MAGLTKAELIEQNARLEAENGFLRKGRIAEGAIQVSLALLRYGTIVVLGYWALQGIRAIAGSSTDANIAVELLANFGVSVTLAWTVALSGGAYGLFQRHLRRNTVERLQGRIRELESIIDPQRTSSELTQRGDTRPEDKL